MLGRYPTQEEAQKVADDYTQACLPDNLPDSYDMGMVLPVAAGEPAALDPDVFRGPGAPFLMDALPDNHGSHGMPWAKQRMENGFILAGSIPITTKHINDELWNRIEALTVKANTMHGLLQ